MTTLAVIEASLSLQGGQTGQAVSPLADWLQTTLLFTHTYNKPFLFLLLSKRARSFLSSTPLNRFAPNSSPNQRHADSLFRLFLFRF